MTGRLARAARQLNAAARHPRLPPLILLTDRRRLADPVAAARRLPPGSLIILRDGDLPMAERVLLGRRLAGVAARRGLRLLVAGDAALAARIGAAGLHWPERQLPPRVRGFATASAHSLAALRRAERAGAGAVLLSPVLPTASHPGAPALGIGRFAALVRASRLPVYALGGLDGRSAGRLAGSGAAGLAAIAAFRA